jgi:hypothetical protein
MRSLAFVIGVLAVALTLTAMVHSGSASPAPAVPVYSVGMGAVLPNDGARAQVGVSCPEHARRACAGSVAIVPRGATANVLGGGAIARATFRLPPGRDVDLRLRLSASARAALKQGPISVTTVLRPSGFSSRTAVRRVTIVRETLYTAPGRRLALSSASADEREFEWSWTIPKGKALAVPRFSCPDDMPRLARGGHFLPYKRGIGGEWDASMRVTAGDGTGYGGFDRPLIGGVVKGGAGNDYRNMLGWPKGDFWFNSIWAPVTTDGHFTLKVTCTSEGPLGGARLGDYGSDNANGYYKNFFPWKWNL